MYSPLVPFQQVIDAIKDATGFTNVRNIYPKLRRFINRIHNDLGYGSALLLKRVPFSVEAGSILVDAFGNKKIRLPDDLVRLEAIGTCENGLCPNQYNIQGNYLFLCDKNIVEFKLVYYALLCDGFGNPTVSENNFEAVVAGIEFMLYKPKMWDKSGNASFYQKLEKDFNDRCGEAIGNEVFPDTADEWAKIAGVLNMSRRDVLIYSLEENCYCCITESEYDASENPNTNSVVYYWQFEDLQTNIDFAPTIDEDYLQTKSFDPLSVFEQGKIITYNNVGRIAFAITNVGENAMVITDYFSFDVTSQMFDTYYNSELQMQVYISKEYLSYGNIFFKINQG